MHLNNPAFACVKRFREEAEAQAKVNHLNVANVASVLDKGKLAMDEDYLVVEFIAGATLRRAGSATR